MFKDNTPMSRVARRKVGIEGWEPYEWIVAHGGVLIRGAVPGVYVRGPKRGEANWRTRDGSTERNVVVTREEIEQEEARGDV